MENSIFNKDKSLNVLELFSGIGAFRKSLDTMWPYKKNLIRSELSRATDLLYIFMFNDNSRFNLGNIERFDHYVEKNNLENTKWDVVFASPPCQGFSIANRFKNSARSIENNSLSGKTLELISRINPKLFIVENVRNFRNSQEYQMFLNLKNYKVESYVFNPINLGFPQSRERVFIVGFRKDYSRYSERVFKNLRSLEKLRLKLKYTPLDISERSFNFEIKKLPKEHWVSKSGNTVIWGRSCDTRAYFINKQVGTITTNTNQPYVYLGCNKYRKLSVLECYRLMEFNDKDYNTGYDMGLTKTFLKQKIGNSIHIGVLNSILREIFDFSQGESL